MTKPAAMGASMAKNGRAQELLAAFDRRQFTIGGAAIAALAGAAGGQAWAARPSPASSNLPKVSGPIVGGAKGWAFGGAKGETLPAGYIEEEYFIEGSAVSYAAEGPLGPDGKWTVKPAAQAPYRTRFIVRRPRSASTFNGTVVVEWNNVSFGFDTLFADAQGLYDGYVYVAVSAQKVGVHDAQGLVKWDPERYGSLSIPGDAYSYDIFTQVGRALGKARARSGVDPLHGLRVREVIAVGVSQSGARLWTYANAVQPLSKAFDALIPVVCAGSGAAIGETGGGSRQGITFSKVREDLATPVLAMNSESECLYYFGQRQPDTARFRYWEVAGASHGPTKQVAVIQSRTRRDGVKGPWDDWTKMSNVMWLPTLDAGIAQVRAWLRGGRGPASQPPITMTVANGRPAIVRDEFGNALGGVRLPELEAPIAKYTGPVGPGGLAGSTEPFSAETLVKLYPTHADYVAKVDKAALAAAKAGTILPYRVRQYAQEARASKVPA